jgi:Lar family restriction alleviation protein
MKQQPHPQVPNFMPVTLDMKKCPFCGSKAKLMRQSNLGATQFWYYITCISCEIKTASYKTIKTALKRWNRRVKYGSV